MYRKLVSIVLFAALILALPLSFAESAGAGNWYEIFVRSFYDSDGDGIGDLKGVEEKLQYVEELGYNGIWLMPVMPSPSYHKYDVTNYCAIDPQYGSLDDMKRLIQACHDRGIRCIIDLPINHTSVQHPWFQYACEALRNGRLEDPYISYYHFTNKPSAKYIRLHGTDWYYEEQFAGGGMPDLDLDQDLVKQEIRSILSFWLKDIGVDGFRLDAVTSYDSGDRNHNISILSWIKTACEEIKSGSYLVGEAWTGLDEIAEYYTSGIDSFFLFPASQVDGYVVKAMNARKSADKWVGYMKKIDDTLSDVHLAPFLSNHDTGRTVGLVRGRNAPERVKMAYGLLNTLTGSVFTYYGEEIGMAGAGQDPNKRLAMFWSEKEPLCEQPPGVTAIEYPFPSAASQAEDPDSILNWYRQINQLRLKMPVLANGCTEYLYTDDLQALFKRYDQNSAAWIAVNLSPKETVNISIDGRLEICAALETVHKGSSVSGDGETTTLTIVPYSIIVLTEVETK